MSIWMVVDVESVGLHGEGFAVGWVVVDHQGRQMESGYAACHDEAASGSASDRAWIREHVVPHLPEPTHAHPSEVRAWFWRHWMGWKKRGAVLAADCCWPVEARFLAACVDDDPEARRWEGPYPLHDVASLRLAAGLDPLGTEERQPDEEPKHHPTADARQSARLLIEALAVVEEP